MLRDSLTLVPAIPWEQLARASGFSDDELAETIAAPEFPISKCVAPNGAILKAKDFLKRAKALTDQEEPERDPRELAYEADCRRIEAMRRRDGLVPDRPLSATEERERMWRVNVKATRTLDPIYRIMRGNKCSNPDCSDEFQIEIGRDGRSTFACPSCQSDELPEEYRTAHQTYVALRARGVSWDDLQAAYKAKVSKLSIDGNCQMAWESTAQWHDRLRRLGWTIPGRVMA